MVLTQSISKENAKKLKKYINELNLNIVGVVPILAENFEVNNGHIEAYGLQELIGLTASILPDSAQKAFINAQKIDIEAKVKAAKRWANTFITTTFAAGFMPIPFSDSMAIIPMQISMLSGITSVFGVSLEKAVFTAMVSSILGSGASTYIGRAVVSNALKMILGVDRIYI